MRTQIEGAAAPNPRRPAIHRRLLAVAVLTGSAGVVAAPASLGAAPSDHVEFAGAGFKPDGISARLAAIDDASMRDEAFITQADVAGLPMVGTGSLVRDGAGRILVDITIDGAAPNADELASVGAELIALAPDERMATVAAPATQLRALAALDGVAYAMEVLSPMRLGGGHGAGNRPAAPLDDFVTNATCDTGITSEGDAQLDADDARTTFTVDGTGINVGIISDSYDDRGGAAADIAAKELPGPGNPCGRTTPVDVLAEIPSGESGIDEGRAMAQIVHDLAPGAELSFATAVGGEIVMAQNIRALAANGADITTDDIAYLFEPVFQDGYIGAAINDNLEEFGVPHFTAAGNSNLRIGGKDVGSYETSSFRPTSCPAGIPADFSSCHDFTPGGGADSGNGFLLAPGGAVSIALGWSEPQFGVTTDLDLFLVNAANNTIVARSVLDSVDLGRANEFLSFSNSSGGILSLNVVVGRFSGTATPRFRHQFLRSDGVTSVERTDSSGGDVIGPTLFGHAGTDAAISVGAIPFDDADTPEDFSSRGPNLICWEPVNGGTGTAPITPCDETTVDVVATDGGANSFFGTFVGGTWRFFGTSASAPHAAAVAALALEHAPCTSAEELVDAMQDSAVDLAGFDPDTIGAGRVDADAMLTSLDPIVGRPCLDLTDSVTIAANATSDPISIGVADADDGAAAVTITATSDNTSVLPDSGLALSGSGASRSLTLTPATDQTGSAIVTLEARDPGGTTATFELQVNVGGIITTFTPTRLVDTRGIGETVDGEFEGIGPIAGGTTLEVDIAGRGGVPDDAAAAVLNLSTTESVGNGFLTIFDCGIRPVASGINYGAGRVVNNEIIAKLSPTGSICIFARTTTHLVIDSVGAADASSGYTPLSPARVVETRIGNEFDTLDGLFEGDGPIGGGSTYEVQIAGRGGVADDAVAAALNLSTVNSIGNGFLTIYDCTTRPLASGINYAAGTVVNNEIIAKLSSTGTICVFARTTTDLVIDVVGEVPADGYNARVPARLVETRAGADFETIDGDFEGDGPVSGGSTYEVQVAGRGGIPGDAVAAVLNLSTVGSLGNGFLTIYDCGTRPLASGINYAAGTVVNNEIIAKLSPTGTICIFARTTTDLVVDAVGDL